MKRRWLWLLLVVPPVCCLGLCGAQGTRVVGENKAREKRAVAALERLELFHADAGVWPATLPEVGVEASGLSYALCPDGGFELAYAEAGAGFLPSDFERRWSPQTQRWELKELGVDLGCR